MSDHSEKKAELTDDQIKAFRKAINQWENGNREPLWDLCPFTAHLFENELKRACELCETTSDQDHKAVKRKVRPVKADTGSNNGKSVARPFHQIGPYSQFRDVVRIMVSGGILDMDEIFNPKGKFNARCLTGIFQFLWDFKFFLNGLDGEKITKGEALKCLNKYFNSNIGDDFYRMKDEDFIKYAFKRLPRLQEIEKEIRRNAPHRLPKPEIYCKYQKAISQLSNAA